MNGHSIHIVWISLLALMIPAFSVGADSAQDPQAAVQELKTQLDAMKAEYEKRIKDLETQLEQLQVQMLQAGPETPEPPTTAPVQSTPGSLNPALSVIGNFLGRVDDFEILDDEGRRTSDKMNLREAELDFRAAVDPYADAVLIAAIESEFPGEFETGVEEGYVTIKKFPFFSSSPAGLKLKVGRFRPSFGQYNILHLHDLPTSFYPLPVEEFLGEEGFIQNGVSANFFIPTPWDSNSSLDATIEVMDGGNIRVSPESDAPISYLGHLRWFRTFQDVNNVQVGYSIYGHPSGSRVGSANLQGFDFLYRWKPLRQGEWKSYILQAEYIYAPKVDVPEVKPVALSSDTIGSSQTPAGFTLLNQWQFNRRIYAGLQYGYTNLLLNSDENVQSVTPYISYYFSEFLRFRFSYEYGWDSFVGEGKTNSVFFELNWIFGAHPPEPFWVNK